MILNVTIAVVDVLYTFLDEKIDSCFF